MPLDLTILPRADRDLMEQAVYIMRDNPVAAARLVGAAMAAFKELARAPGLGSCYCEASTRLRELRRWRIPGFERYLIFYRTSGDRIEIVRVLHGARDLVALLDEDEPAPD